MKTISPYHIVLNPAEEGVLEYRARGERTPHRDVQRARIILAAARGDPHARIAAEEGVHPDTVGKWCKRFYYGRMPALADMHRSGRPPVFSNLQVAGIRALACTPPPDKGLPLARFSSGGIANLAISEGLVESISPVTVSRWLAADAIKPWQHRSWIFPRDPAFGPKASRTLDLYGRQWEGQPLGPDEYVISADEKSQLQALHRTHPDLGPAPGRKRRIEFEYERGGTLAYFAAYDVHQAHVIGTIAPKTGIVPFSELVDLVMNTEPYASAARVFWVVDNGSSHHGQRSVDRMEGSWPTATLVHLPVHASWLNQVEIYFSIVQRKAISTGDFTDLDALAERILAFQEYYNQTAEPFHWRYTRQDLTDHLHRLSAYEPVFAA